MGAWGTGLYSNDTTSDVRDTYMNFLETQLLSNEEAYKKTFEAYKDIFNSEFSEEPLFWYALADTQWKVGRLTSEVKDKALEWIDKSGGIELWEESKSGETGWKKTLEKLRIRLETEQRKEKRFKKKHIPFQNPWNTNDVYAYKVNKWTVEEKQKKVFGKYLLIQKIGEEQSLYSIDTVMLVQIYDRLFDNMPTEKDVMETIKNGRLLPFVSPARQISDYKFKLSVEQDPGFVERHPKYADIRQCQYEPLVMSKKMEQYVKSPSYPKDYLTYICTAEGIYNKQHLRTDGSIHRDSFYSLMWNTFEYAVGKRFEWWQEVEYEMIGDGTFEYPTLKHQEQIRS